MSQNTKMLLGAVVAAALAIAVYYGLLNQQTANNIQNQANQTLGTTPAAQQPASPTTPNAPAQPAPSQPAPSQPSPAAPALQNQGAPAPQGSTPGPR